MNMEDYIKRKILAKSYLAGGEISVRLIAQLLDVAPCPKCDYVKKHCKCKK